MVGSGGMQTCVFCGFPFRKCYVFRCEFVLAALSQRSFPFRRFVRIRDVHFVTQLAAAQDAACLQSAVQLVAVSASTVDDDPW